MSYGWRDLGQDHFEELCDECGFDSRRSDVFRDLPAALDALARQERELCSDIRPEAGTWSAEEYVDHCLDTASEAVAVILSGDPEQSTPFDGVAPAKEQITSLLHELDRNQMDREIDVGGPFPASPAWMLNHLLHEVEHHVLDIRRGYARMTLADQSGPSVWR